MAQVGRHASLLRNERQIEHIQAEYQARQDALKHFEFTEKKLRRQEYDAIKTDVAPFEYYAQLDRLQARFIEGTDRWLVKDSMCKSWLDNDDTTVRLLWLQGIPAAGRSCQINH